MLKIYKLFRHPPRSQLVKLQENIHSFIHEETEDDRKTYDFNIHDGFLKALIQETIANGYKYDLCLMIHYWVLLIRK